MDTSLVLITIISAGAAAILAAVCWRMVREDRRRAAARVMALRAELARAEPDLTDDLDFATAPAVPARTEFRESDRGTSVPSHIPPAAPRPASPVHAADARLFGRLSASGSSDDHALARDTSDADGDQMFATVRRTRASGRRPALMLIGVAVVAFALGSLFLSGRAEESSMGAAVNAMSNAPSLELLSMRHVRQGNTWTITGLVRNPEGHQNIARANAVVFLFARDGSFLGSGRAPLDFATLAPGDESPFVITTTASGPVGRYRISFRADDGRMMRHVDKRQTSAGTTSEGQER